MAIVKKTRAKEVKVTLDDEVKVTETPKPKPLDPVSNESDSDYDFTMPVDLVEEEKAKLTSDDFDSFLQTVVSEVPYESDYESLGGKLVVVFRSKTVEEIDASYAYMKTQKEIEYENEYISLAAQMDMAFYLKKINGEDFDKGSIMDRIARIKKFPGIKFSLINSLLSRFLAKCDALQKESLRPDFSFPAGGTS